jgi:superoxide reductase
MATKDGQKYKCEICGNEVVVTHEGGGELVCCGQPMGVIGEGFSCSA